MTLPKYPAPKSRMGNNIYHDASALCKILEFLPFFLTKITNMSIIKYRLIETNTNKQKWIGYGKSCKTKNRNIGNDFI